MKNIYFNTKNKLQFLALFAAFLIGGVISANAQVRVGFTQRTSQYTPTKKIYNVKGDFTMLGNTCLTPQNYSATTNNNGQFMTYVDTDGDINTLNSSSSTLEFSNENNAIPECSNVVYAGLYWTGKSSASNTFTVSKDFPNGTHNINTDFTVGHNQNVSTTNFALSVSRNGNNGNRNPVYTFAGNGNTYAFYFYNSDQTNRVRVSVNGGGLTTLAATINGAGTEATLTTPYAIVDGTATITVKKLFRNAGVNNSSDLTQSSSTALVNVNGVVPNITTITKNYDKRVISLKGPGEANYTQFTAGLNDIYYPSGTDDDIYSAYTEITSYVRDHGIGQYWAADMALLEGNADGTGYSGGWGIIVVYENSKMKYRDVTIFDGYAYVQSTNGSALNLPVTGFNTVQSGHVGIKLGVMASEGDVAFTGDYFKIKKLNTANYLSLSHSGNTTTNFFNSSINAGGARNPMLANNTGIDVSMFTLANAEGATDNTVIGNNQTSTNFQYGTDGDTYSIFAIAMAVDAYIPNSEGNISAMTIDGVPAGPGPYNALPGQELGFKIQIKNKGSEAINNFKLTVPVPYNCTYVAGSAQKNVLFTPLPNPNTIVFDPSIGSNGSIVLSFGQLPLPGTGSIPADPETLLAEMTFKFKVTEDCTLLKNTNCNNVIAVNGIMTGTGAVTGVTMGNKSLIQGYTANGTCQGTEIAAPLLVNVNAVEFVNLHCQAVPPITAFFICNSGSNIPITIVGGAFPPGSTFYNQYPVVSGTTVQYTISNPFPSTVGTSTYYAVPPGVLGGCYFQFTITVTTVTTQPTVTNVQYCVGATAAPLTATPSAPGMTLYYYTDIDGIPQTSITPSTVVAGQTTYYVSEAQSLSCIGPKKPIVVTVYPLPQITAPANTTLSGCATSAITGLPFSTVATPITLAQLTTAGGSVPNSASIGTYAITYIDVATGTDPVVVTRTFSITNICGTAVVATQVISIKDNTAPVVPTLTNVTGQCSATATPPTTTDVCSGSITGTTLDPLTYNTQGTFTIHWTFNDGHGNSATANQTVIVDDTVAPVVPTLVNVTGQCSATATPPTTTDLCAGTITGTTTDPLTYNTQGTFTIHWTFNDGNGNTATANQTVIVQDTGAPAVPTLANVTGQCSATVTAPTTTDGCSATVITGTTNDPLTYNIQGTFTIHWSFNDGNGNIATANQTVIVDDTTAPAVPALANVTGQCSATATPPTTTDVCAGTITGTATDPLTYTTQGTFIIHWTFNDGNGNTSTADQTVIVDDTTAPAVPALANVTGQCSATATPPTTTDVCAGTIAGTTTDPLTYNTQGTFTIHWTFNDGNGNTSTADQTVIVDDTTAPVVPALANVTGQCSATATPPTTTDNCAGTLTATTTDPLTYTTQGTFIIHWTFNDGNGNTSTVNQTVIVQDTAAPVVPVLADVTGQCSATATVPTTTDGCSATVITGTTNDPLTYNTQGTFVIHWSFNDGNGNITTANQTVIVDDTTAPAVPTLANVTGQCSATATPPTTTDNCSGTITGTTTNPLTYNTQGTFTITWTFNDGNGNTSTATQTVIVDDTIAPVVSELATITGECSATATPPTTTDNCSGTLVATTNDPLTYNTQGTFIIHWTFNDGNGNTSTVNQTVIIDDVTAPVVPTLADVTGQCSATAVPPTTTDNCAGTIAATTTDPLTYTAQGTFVIHWTFNDGNGNTSTVNQNVVVDNTTPPTIPVLADVTGQCSATATPPTTTNSCSGATVTGTTTDPLVYNNQGTFVITWTFNDGNGNTVTATQNVIVDDTTAPVVPTLANVTGECSATATPPSTTDNCSGTIVGTTNDPLVYNNQGTFTITWTFNDGNGNISTATQTVIVDDVTAPVVPTVADVTGECSACAVAPTTTDNCAGTLTATTQDALCYETQGTHVITWTFNDGNGNTSTVTQNVIIDDVTAPVVPTLADVTGQCSACAVAPTTTDNCGGTITGTTTDALCYTEQGTFVITWTFNDGNGNTSTATQNVIIDNTTPPVIPALADVTGQCSACAVAPTTTNSCTGVTITATTQDPLCYETQGTFVITWSFDDGNGNIVTATQNVIVDDTTAPVVPTLADATGECSACAVAPTTTDNCVGTITGTTTDELCYTTQGTHVITWTFDDGNGNTSTATQNVVVLDVTPPVVPTLADVTGECSACAVAPTTTDNCAGTLTATTQDALCYETQGTHVITWTFDDGNGNITTVTQNVIIDDVTAPVVPTLADVTGQCSACAVAPTTTDNCGGTITGTTTDALCYTEQGTFVITWTFDDGNGNTSTATQNVIIDNTTPPVIAPLADVTGECSACATAPTTTNSCTGVTITGTTTDPLCYTEQGTYVITWSFDDGNGNIVTATQNVIVHDVTPPVVPTLADATGECSACAVAPTTTDNCAGTITGTTTDELCYTTQGTHVITWTFNDGNGNTSTATQNVVVLDVTPPVVPTLADVTGECSACVVAPTTTDNCAGTLTATTTDELCYTTQGTFIVHWTFDDGNGNTSTVNQTVIVDDVTAPAVPTLADVTGQCSACAVAPTTTDNCAVTVTGTTTDPLCYTEQGTYVITWTFDDGNGNVSTATQNVIIDNTTAPIIPELADVTGECSACAVAPVFTNICTGATITATTTDALCYTEQGTYVITWTFDDGNGNIVTATQNVIVHDTTAPTVPTLADVTGECSACAVAPTTTDNCAGTITGTTTDELCYTTQGTHVITWTFNDGNGNISTATQNVIINDVTAPVVPTLTDVIAECSVSVTPPSTTDGCSGQTVITGTTLDPIDFSTQGTYMIHWTFNDGNGNISTAIQNVIVDDTTAPVAPTLADVTGQCSACAVAPTTTDNCAGIITATTTDPLCYTEQGTYSITWTFDDGNGNSINVFQTVIVDDTTAPEVPALADAQGQCSLTLTAPVVPDNCSATGITGTTDQYTFSPGDYVVTWSFDDGHGNVATATQNVHVSESSDIRTATGYAECNADDAPERNVDLNALLEAQFPGISLNGSWAGNSTGLQGSIFVPFGIPVGHYPLVYTVTDGVCPVTVNMDLEVDDECGVLPCGNVVVHNAFSPNGDGNNETFQIDGIADECIVSNSIEIYNRWGVLIYETSMYDNLVRVFKGFSEGRVTVSGSEELPTGTYFYLLKYARQNAANGEITSEHKEGYLYLSR